MNLQYPISDMLIRIKNAQISKKVFVLFTYSKIKINITKLLYNEGFINKYNIINNNINIYLKYFKNKPVIEKIKIISKPSVRIYYKLNDIYNIKNNIGFFILSTNKGIMTHIEAKKNKIGGEAIFYIY